MCFLCLVNCKNLKAQFQFEPVASNDRASSTLQVNQFSVASNGKMFLATTDGLYQIRENQLIPVLHDVKTGRVSKGDDVKSVFEDSDRNIWLTSKAISKLSNSGFYHLELDSEMSVSCDCYVLGQFNNSNVIIGGIDGFAVFFDGKIKSEIILANYESLNDAVTSPIAISNLGDEYIVGFAKGGVWRYSIKNDSFYKIDNQSSFSTVFKILKVSESEYFLGTDSGLWIYNYQTKNLRKSQHNIDGKITEILKLENDAFLIGAEGLYYLNGNNVRQFNEFSFLSNERGKQISALFIDNEKSIWLAFKEGGIYKSSPSRNKVKSLKINYPDNSSVKIGTRQLVSSADNILIANQLGVFKLSPDTDKLSKNTLPKRTPIQKLAYSKDRIYAASLHELSIVSTKTNNKIENTNLKWNNPSLLSSISALIIDNKENIWVGAYGFEDSELIGLKRLASGSYELINNSAHNKALKNFDHHFITFLPEINSLMFSYYSRWSQVYSILENEIIYDERKRGHGVYNLNTQQSGNTSIFASKSGDFYSTYWDIKKNTLAPFTKIGVPIKDAQCLIETDPGEYWLAQKNGSVFYWNSHSDELIEYDAADGSSTAGLTGKSCIEHSETGKLYFAANDGLVIVDPTNIPTNTVQPNIYIEDIRVDRSDIELKIEHDQSISFNLRVDSYAVPSENRLKTRLRGISDWIERPASQNEQQYSQLAAGSYIFEVMGSNNDGVWSEPKQLKFEILPPWWRSNIALAIYALAMFLAVVLFFRVRTKQLQQRAKLLQIEVEQRTEELAQEKQVVESLLEQKNNEFANVSHEFRTPLTLILGPINKLLNKSKVADDRNALSMIQRNTQRLVRMVDQILHLERHKLKQVTEIVTQDVSGTLNLIYQSFVSLTEEKSLAFEVNIEDNLRVDLAADSLDKIVINLVSNAIKYTPRNGSITLNAWQENQQVHISVSDSGYGIAAEKQQEVFQKFSRVLDEHSEKITGAGIGLALVKELVESQSGQIVLHSELGKGSKFEVIFPISDKTNAASAQVNTDFVHYEVSNLTESAPEPTQSTAKQIQETGSDNQPLILVVEDNPDMREYIVSNLSPQFRCIEAANGRVGVEMAIEQIPDLIISDVMMPEMDGFELSNAIKTNSLTSHIPLILLTARGDKKSRIRGWREHADEYLTKPFDADELQIRIENLLTIRDMIRRRYHHDFFAQQPTDITSMNEGSSLDELDNEFTKSLHQRLEALYQDHTVTIDDIAKISGCSNRQFQRKISGLMDVTPSQMLREFRLGKSADLLRQGHKPNMVYLEAGFSSHSYFSRCFKAKYNCSPSDFLNSP
jgi:signal transduction histidine kinase/DNA-binding response OmpR family regulator